MPIYAILNADDFGLSPGINRGIIEAHRYGIVTSVSLMAVGDAFEEAVAFAHEALGLSLGIHLTLVEGRPVLPPDKVPSLVTADGRFCQSLGTFLLRWLAGKIRMPEVQREFAAQIEKALDHGLRVDKLDSHMHLHLLPGICQAVLAVAGQYRIPAIRLPRERVLKRDNRLNIAALWRRATLTTLAGLWMRPAAAAGLFYAPRFSGVGESGQLTEEDLLRLLRGLQPGITEVMLHPGYRDRCINEWPMSRRYEREPELKALTSPRVKAMVQERQIKLVNFRTVFSRDSHRG